MDSGNRQEKEMWVQRALLLLALLALLPPAGAYPARLTRAVSSYAVGGAGPMGIAQLQAGTAQTCAVDAAAANGYQAGQVYTITMLTNGQHKFEPSAGTVAGLAYNQNSYQWTAPNTGVAPVTFRALCATGRTTGYLASSTVQSGGGGGGQAGGGGGGGQAGGGGGGGGQATAGGLVQPAEALTSTKIEKVVTSAPPNECCGLDTGALTVSAGASSRGVSTVSVSGQVTGQCQPGRGFTSLSLDLEQQMLQASGTDTQFVSLLLGGPSIRQVPPPAGSTGRVSVELAFTGIGEAAVLTMTVLGEEGNPTICDATFTFKAADDDVNALANANGGGGGGAGGTIAIVIIVVLLVLAGIAFYVKSNSGGGGGGAKPAVAVSMPVKPAGGGTLKPNWKAAQDAEGDTYYYNSATGETTWEKHLVMA